MSADPLFSPAARAQSRRKPAVRTTRLPGDPSAVDGPDPLAHLPALVADLHTARGSHLSRAEIACAALRDAPVSDALLRRIGKKYPAFAAALVLAWDCADESEG